MKSSPTNALLQNAIGATISGSAQVINAGRDVVIHRSPTGCGKLVSAQTVAERCAGKGSLLGGFFLQGAGDLSSISRLIPTLADQISLSTPATKKLLKRGLRGKPAILSLSVSVAYQFQKLIINPTHSTTSKSPTGKHVASAKFGATGKNTSPAKGASRAGAKKVVGAKASTKGASRAGSKKAAGAKSPTKGTKSAGSKKGTGAHTPKSLAKGAGPNKAAGAKSPAKGGKRAGSKKVACGRTSKSLAKGAGLKKAAGAKSPVEGGGRAGANKATSKVGGTRKSAIAGAKKPASKNTGAKPTSKVAGKSTSKSLAKGAAGAKKVASNVGGRKSTSKVASPTKGATGGKKAAGALSKAAPKKITPAAVSGGKGALKIIASPQNLKKAASLTATVASKAGKEGR